MLRSLLFTMLVALAANVHAEVVVPLKLGESEIRIAVPDGYLRASEKAPSYFERSAAALPPPIRLVEALVAEADVKRMLAGLDLAQPYVQVQVMRDVEAIELTAADWKQLQPMLVQQLGAVDINTAAQSMEKGMNERMGKATGSDSEIQFGKMGQLHIYSQDDGVVRYATKLPISGNFGGKTVDFVLDYAGAMLVLNGKFLTINVYHNPAGEDDNGAAVRASLDQIVARARALNGPRAAN